MLYKIIEQFKKTNEKKGFFNKRSKYLLGGKCLFSNSLKYLYLDDNVTKSSLYNLFENDPLISVNYKLLLFKNAFLRSIYVREKESSANKDFIGTIYLFSKNHEEDKIFDLNNKKVLSFLNNSSYKKRIKSYNLFHEYFNMPKMYECQDNKILEELITFKHNWSKHEFNQVLKQITENYIEYFKKEKDKIIYTKPICLLDRIDNEEYQRIFKQNISRELLEMDFPTITLHGDLRKNNILLEETSSRVYLIDWENSNFYFPFYDIFFLIYHEAIHNSNIILLNSYLSGRYDTYFKEIFAIFDLEFKEVNKVDYFLLFCLEHFVKKVKQNPKIYNYYQKLYYENVK